MRRRTLIQAAAAAALTGILPRRTRADTPESALYAFAATIAPGSNAGAWLTADEKSRLAARYAALDSVVRSGCNRFLAALDQAAGGSFAALAPDRRVSLLAERAAGGGDDFSRLRALVLGIYFTGEAGLELSGYRDCTQFEGYPEYLEMSKEWE